MAEAMVSAGTTVAAATPHIDHHFGIDPGLVAGRREAFAAELADRARSACTSWPAARSASRLLDLADDELDALTLGGGPYLLVEAPLTLAAGDFDPLISALMERGRKVLLGHPERCPGFHRRPERIEALVQEGALCQLTASAFGGAFGQTVQRFAMALLRRGLVHVASSDSHDAYRRPPELRRPLERARVPEELIGWLTETVPGAVLAGSEVPPWRTAPGTRCPRSAARSRASSTGGRSVLTGA